MRDAIEAAQEAVLRMEMAHACDPESAANWRIDTVMADQKHIESIWKADAINRRDMLTADIAQIAPGLSFRLQDFGSGLYGLPTPGSDHDVQMELMALPKGLVEAVKTGNISDEDYIRHVEEHWIPFV